MIAEKTLKDNGYNGKEKTYLLFSCCSEEAHMIY